MSTRVSALIALACSLRAPLEASPQSTPATQPPSPAQESVATPKDLAEMLDAALRSNPEVLQAEARVRQAQADLNQVRLAVTQKVVSAYHERQKQNELLDYAKEQADMSTRRFATGTATAEESHKMRAEVARARAALAQSEAQIRYILGTHYPGTHERTVGSTGDGSPFAQPGAAAPAGALPHPTPPEIPEGIRQSLDIPVTLVWTDEETLREVVATLSELTGQNFVLDDSLPLNDSLAAPLQLSSKITLRNALLAIADRTEACFVFRDYGVLVTTAEKASTLRSASIPPREELLDRQKIRTPGRN